MIPVAHTSLITITTQFLFSTLCIGVNIEGSKGQPVAHFFPSNERFISLVELYLCPYLREETTIAYLILLDLRAFIPVK
jgi:hypothetical protein